MRLTLSVVVAFLLSAPLGAEGLRIIQMVETQGVPGQEGAFEETVLLSGENVRAETPDFTLILQPAEGTLLILDPHEKTYAKMPVSQFQSLAASAGRLVPGGMGEVSLQETGRTRTIGDWKVREVRLDQDLGDAGHLEVVAWVTDDLGVDISALNRISESLSPFGEVSRSLAKSGGMPVEIHSTLDVMGRRVTSSQRVLQVARQEIDPSAFAVPEGYVHDEGLETGLGVVLKTQ